MSFHQQSASKCNALREVEAVFNNAVHFEMVTIAYEVSMDQQYGYGVCCKLVLKYYDYILLLLFVMFICDV